MAHGEVFKCTLGILAIGPSEQEWSRRQWAMTSPPCSLTPPGASVAAGHDTPPLPPRGGLKVYTFNPPLGSPPPSTSLDWLVETGRYAVVPPTSKRLACGDVGVGGLADVADIVAAVAAVAEITHSLTLPVSGDTNHRDGL